MKARDVRVSPVITVKPSSSVKEVAKAKPPTKKFGRLAKLDRRRGRVLPPARNFWRPPWVDLDQSRALTVGPMIVWLDIGR